MRISNIKIKNFKSFKYLSLDLNNPNVFIGSCSSGKSNLFEVFQFLKDISEDFQKGINKHGGQYIKNIKSQDEPIHLSIIFDDETFEKFKLTENEIEIPKDKIITLDFKKIKYGITFDLNNFDYEILKENIEFEFDICESFNKEVFKSSKNKLCIKNENRNIKAYLEKEERQFEANDIIPKSLINIAQNNFKQKNIPLINSPLSSVPIPWIMHFREQMFFDFIPQICKSIPEINGESSLLKYGENLPIALNNVLNDEKNKKKFNNLLKDLLPDVEELTVDDFGENKRAFSIIERFSNEKILSPLVSDGTSNIIALITALYFEKSNIIFIEEAEKNIHPSLFGKIVQMINEASKEKQIFITTHSPEILKNIDLDKVYFISRDDDGFSKITKPNDNETLNPLIKELGIDEIFVDNYLDIE